MQKITFKENRIKMLIVFFILLIIPINTNVFAATASSEAHLKEVVEDKSESKYKEIELLIISNDDIEYIDEIDFSKFDNIKHLFILDIYLSDASKIKFKKKLESLYISNSVANLKTINLNDYDKVNIVNTYILDGKIDDEKIGYSNFLNPEYEIDSKYDEKINDIAKSIYLESDKTTDDIIKRVTQYVVDNIEYDYKNEYTHLPILESILEKRYGVCAHYALFESILLNKLGIFALNVGGYTNPDNIANSTHGWTLIWKDNQWYNIDATWLDPGAYNGEVPNDINKYYMAPINSSEFNETHYPYFTNYNNIPVSERTSKISILSTLEEADNKPNQDTDNKEENNKDENNESENKPEENPDTGTFISSIIILTSMLLVILINYIAKRVKKFNHI